MLLLVAVILLLLVLVTVLALHECLPDVVTQVDDKMKALVRHAFIKQWPNSHSQDTVSHLFLPLSGLLSSATAAGASHPRRRERVVRMRARLDWSCTTTCGRHSAHQIGRRRPT